MRAMDGVSRVQVQARSHVHMGDPGGAVGWDYMDGSEYWARK